MGLYNLIKVVESVGHIGEGLIDTSNTVATATTYQDKILELTTGSFNSAIEHQNVVAPKKETIDQFR